MNEVPGLFHNVRFLKQYHNIIIKLAVFSYIIFFIYCIIDTN